MTAPLEPTMKFLWPVFLFSITIFITSATRLIPAQPCASAFCSSFVPIVKNTATATRTGPQQFQTVTITPDTATATATITTGAEPLRRANPTCTIKGLPIQIKPFACDVIKKACVVFVKPGTTTMKNDNYTWSHKYNEYNFVNPNFNNDDDTSTTSAGPTCRPGLFDPIHATACDCTYDISCDTTSSTTPLVGVSAADYAGCAGICDGIQNCAAFYFAPSNTGLETATCNLYGTGNTVTPVTSEGETAQAVLIIHAMIDFNVSASLQN
ncbi:hypothetical protein DL98DRAFT_595959 [Cadophora sp. DSE1049]|nr:hypothetical protein DL98DRAFT_595959 [Cadophora sp. DSE1049]